METLVMTKDGKADRLARTAVERVQLSYEGYVEKTDEQPALSLPAPDSTPEHDDATVAPFTIE